MIDTPGPKKTILDTPGPRKPHQSSDEYLQDLYDALFSRVFARTSRQSWSEMIGHYVYHLKYLSGRLDPVDERRYTEVLRRYYIYRERHG